MDTCNVCHLHVNYQQFNGFFLSVFYSFWNLNTVLLKQSFQKTFSILKFQGWTLNFKITCHLGK